MGLTAAARDLATLMQARPQLSQTPVFAPLTNKAKCASASKWQSFLPTQELESNTFILRNQVGIYLQFIYNMRPHVVHQTPTFAAATKSNIFSPSSWMINFPSLARLPLFPPPACSFPRLKSMGVLCPSSP